MIFGYSGTSPVDTWLATQVAGALITVNTYGFANATDIYDGRANTHKLKASAAVGAGLMACTNKGSGWYVPAAEEFCLIAKAGFTSLVLDRSNVSLSTLQTANLATMGMTCCAISGDGAGLHGILSGVVNDAVHPQSHTICVWRP